MNRGTTEKNKGRHHELVITAFLHLPRRNLISESLIKGLGS